METAENPFAELSYNKTNFILHIKIRQNADLSLAIAQLHGKQITELTQNKPHLVLIDVTHFFTINDDALKYASVPCNLENRIAAAYYNPDLANWLTIKIFAQSKPLTFPVEVFKTEAEALQWLKTFKL